MTMFSVGSETVCVKKQRPDLCWMDIPEYKIDQAISVNEIFRLEYHHFIEGSYMCSFVYALPAQQIKASLLQFRKNICVDINKSPKYRVYLHYKTGRLYTAYSGMGIEICQLKPVYRVNPCRLSSFALRKAIQSITAAGINPLLQLVAGTAIWAPKKAVSEQNPDNFIYVRRRPSDPEKGKKVDGIIYDDNTHPNRLIKAAVKKHLGFGIAPKEYAVCHVWEGTCYDKNYYTDIRNLVLLPRALASLSDYDEDVSNMLKYRAFKIYDGWHPAKHAAPEKFPVYNKLTWLNLSSMHQM